MGNECKNKDLPPIAETECPQDVNACRYTIQVFPVSGIREIIREELENYFRLNEPDKGETPIEKFDLSVRLYNLPKGNKIDTIEKAKTLKKIDFMRFRNAKSKSWEELEDVIDEFNTVIKLKRGQ